MPLRKTSVKKVRLQVEGGGSPLKPRCVGVLTEEARTDPVFTGCDYVLRM
jgi:hypothetical protein